ncbi:MAG: hypothetical protein VW907_05885, partial [Opitutae bacterium]
VDMGLIHSSLTLRQRHPRNLHQPPRLNRALALSAIMRVARLYGRSAPIPAQVIFAAAEDLCAAVGAEEGNHSSPSSPHFAATPSVSTNSRLTTMHRASTTKTALIRPPTLAAAHDT